MIEEEKRYCLAVSLTLPYDLIPLVSLCEFMTGATN